MMMVLALFLFNSLRSRHFVHKLGFSLRVGPVRRSFRRGPAVLASLSLLPPDEFHLFACSVSLATFLDGFSGSKNEHVTEFFLYSKTILASLERSSCIYQYFGES